MTGLRSLGSRVAALERARHAPGADPAAAWAATLPAAHALLATLPQPDPREAAVAAVADGRSTLAAALAVIGPLAPDASALEVLAWFHWRHEAEAADAERRGVWPPPDRPEPFAVLRQWREANEARAAAAPRRKHARPAGAARQRRARRKP